MDRETAAVFIDASNLHYQLRLAGWQIDWIHFKNYFQNRYEIDEFSYYEGTLSLGVYMDNNPGASKDDFLLAKKKKKEYFRFLRSKNYRVRTKPVSKIYDSTKGTFIHKCNFDVELTVDAVDRMESYENFILCSGDGDFERLIRYLKSKRKKTIILSPKKGLSNNLANAANQGIFLEDLRDEFERHQ